MRVRPIKGVRTLVEVIGVPGKVPPANTALKSVSPSSVFDDALRTIEGTHPGLYYHL
jgi:hypothetical protein